MDCHRALLLQGPAGPFMRRFGMELRAQGIDTWKINFHAGDVLFYPGPQAVSYRGAFHQWAAFVRGFMQRRHIDALFVFGDCRPYHRIAVAEARRLGISIWALDEGYLRPDWITLEREGVNGNSPLPREASFYREMEPGEAPAPRAVRARFGAAAWYSTLNALAFTHLNRRFPNYLHHRRLNAWYQTRCWLTALGRRYWFAWRERETEGLAKGPLRKKYFFIPLQVHLDFSLEHSKYGRNLFGFVEEVIESFARCGRKEDCLVFKHHPMDRPYREYSKEFAALRRSSGLHERLIYVHDVDLSTLIKNARGTITINSTVGLYSIHHQTPVIAMGKAVYDLPGLAFQGTLDDFIRAPEQGTPDRELYQRFRRHLLDSNQHNGSFYNRLEGLETPTGVRWHNGQ